MALGEFVTASSTLDATKQWGDHLDQLRDHVERWTGNPLQLVDLPFAGWRHTPATRLNRC